MYSKEIQDFINKLIEQNQTRLDIIQKVMAKFGKQHPEYSFKKWSSIISDAQAQSRRPEVRPVAQSTHTAKNETRINADTKSYIDENKIFRKLYQGNINGPGMYRILFRDNYSISNTELIQLFRLAILHIGPRLIKTLNIKINSIDLICYYNGGYRGSDYKSLYPSCYLYAKLSSHDMVNILYDLTKKLSLDITLFRGSSIVFIVKSDVNSDGTQSSNILSDDKPLNPSTTILKKIVPVTKSTSSSTPLPEKDVLLVTSTSLPKKDIPSTNSTATLTNVLKHDFLKDSIKSNKGGLSLSHPDIIPNKSVDSSASTKSIEDYISVIRGIQGRIMSGEEAPHQPIFLLTLIELIDKGYVINNMFYFDETMLFFFDKMWDKYNNRTAYSNNIASPFLSLTLQGFWRVKFKDAKQKPVAAIYWLRENVLYGYLDPKLFTLLQNQRIRQLFIDSIVARFALKQ